MNNRNKPKVKPKLQQRTNKVVTTQQQTKVVKAKPNVRAFLNVACEVANEIVVTCGSKTKAGLLLNDDELRNFKTATDLLTKARELTIKQSALKKDGPTNSVTHNNLITSASSDELKALLVAAAQMKDNER